MTISIVQSKGPPQAGGGPTRTPKQRVLAELEHRLKLGAKRPSDEVEGLQFEVKWEPTPYVLAMMIPPELLAMAPEELTIVSVVSSHLCVIEALPSTPIALTLSRFYVG